MADSLVPIFKLKSRRHSILQIFTERDHSVQNLMENMG